MNNAQLSFHGYRDAVKFFVAVPGQPPSKIIHEDETNSESLLSSTSTTMDTSALAFGDILVVSGGDGYIDFRIGDSTTEKAGLYFVHISALTIACRRLWIGTGNGIIISVPLQDSKKSKLISI